MSLASNVRKLVPKAIKNIMRNGLRFYKLSALLSPYIPNTICIDVGASYYPHEKWYIFLNSPKTYWVAVEPNKENIEYTKKWRWPSKVSVCLSGLSKDGGSQTLYITNVDSGSSLLQPIIGDSLKHRGIDLDYFFPIKESNIDTITLKDVIPSHANGYPIFVKLDTQGTELSILKGSESLFSDQKILGIEMESTMLAQPIMSGSGKFWQACEYLESKGFELLHVKPIYSPLNKKQFLGQINTFLTECDAVFALRWDIVSKMPIEYRASLLAFYITNFLYLEAKAVLVDDKNLIDFLKNRGCNVNDLQNNLTCK